MLNNKITQKELEKAKSYASGLLTSNLEDSDTDDTLKSKLKILDSITFKDLQTTAKIALLNLILKQLRNNL